MDLSTDLGVVSQADQDALTRLTLAEAGNQPAAGQQAVASTAVNRAQLTGEPISQIASDPGAYPGVKLHAYQTPATDPNYQAVAANLAPVFTNGPTTPATHYINPTLYASQNPGKPEPAWAGPGGTKIGDQVFYTHPEQFKPSGDVMAAFEAQKAGTVPPAAPVGTAPLAPVPGATEAGDQSGGLIPPDVMAAFEAAHAKAAPSAPAAATPGSMFDQFLQGAGNSIEGVGNQVLGATPGGMFSNALRGMATGAENVGNLVRYGLNGGPLPVYEQPSPFGQLVPQMPQISGTPQNAGDLLARNVGTYLPGAAFGGGEGLLPQLASRALNSVVPALSATAAQEGSKAMGMTPGEQQIAGTVGGIAGGLGAGVAQGGATALRGIFDPFVANVSRKAAETQAGQILANRATDFGASTRALAGYEPLVSGSPATVGDVTGDLGLLGLSRATATKNSPEYSALTTAQAGARDTSLRSISPNADPMALAEHVRGTVADLDAQTQAAVDQATQAAQAKAQAAGGQGNPEDYGGAVRGAVQDALTASDAREKGLWDAIDPDGKVTVGVSPPRLAARNILGGMTEDTLAMSPQEKSIFDRVAAWPDSLPLRNVVEMRKQINSVLGDNPSDVTAGRLKALRGAIADNLSGAATPESTTRIQAWENGQQPTSVAAQSGNGTSNQPVAGGEAPIQAGAGGAALPAGGGLGSVTGTSGISGQISPDLRPIMVNGQVAGYTTPEGTNISAAAAKSWQPNVSAPTSAVAAGPSDADVSGRIAAANAATAEQAQTFRQGPVAPVLKTVNGYAGQYQMPAGKVPGQFFHPGPTGFSDMQALAKASPEALPAIQDYAASTLQGMAKDGVIDSKTLANWNARYGDSIRALPPELQAKFADAATAGDTVAKAVAARKAALDAANSGAIGKILGAPDAGAVTSYVGNILRSPTAATDMQSLVDATATNPAARAGLKQAVVDHILNNYITNTEAGASGVNKISADKFQTFLKTAGPALGTVLDGGEMTRLRNIGADIQQSQRTLQATKLPGQSNTAQDIYAGGLPGSGKPSLLLDYLAGSIAEGSGNILAHVPGAGLAAAGAAHLLQTLRMNGINTVNDLVKRAVFDPPLAAALMSKVNGPNLSATQGAGQALIKALAGPTIVATQPKREAQSSALQGIAP